MLLPVGMVFSVQKEYELYDDKGKLIANYVPGLSYKITPTNQAFVSAALEQEFAQLEAEGAGKASLSGRGTVT